MGIAGNLKPLVIFGSSRSNGNTWKAIQEVFEKRNLPIVDLNNLNISAFDYDYKNKDDDFLELAKQMVNSSPIVLATPVYWYMPSAVIKTFIDRLSDLLIHEKDIGRELKGKDLYLVSSYHVHPEGKEGFEQIFKQICQYMSINYQGCYFYYTGDDQAIKNTNLSRAKNFAKMIFKKQKKCI